MNFVLHRHLAHRDLGSTAAGLGAMLPDLWRMADRRMRARRGAGTDPDGPLRDLLAGIRHHLAVDAWFHDHPVFTEGLADTHAELEAFEAPRLRLFGHVAWELCLDGAWVRSQGEKRAVAQVRESAEAAAEERLRRVAELHRPLLVEQPDIADRLEERLAGLLAAIAEGEWVAGYAHGDGLVARLQGVRRRFGFEPFSERVSEPLAACFEGLLVQAGDRLGELLDHPPPEETQVMIP